MKNDNIKIIYHVVIITLLITSFLEAIFFFSPENMFGCFTFILGWILLYNTVLKNNRIKCFFPYFALLGLGISFYWLPLMMTLLEGKPLTFRFENAYLTFFNQFLNLVMLICAYKLCFKVYKQDNVIQKFWKWIGYFKAPSDKQVWILGFIGLLCYVSLLTIQGTEQAEGENLGFTGHLFQVLRGFSAFPFILLFKGLYGGKGYFRNYVLLILYFAVFIVLGISTGKRGSVLMPFASLAFCYILPAIVYNTKIFTTKNVILIVILTYLVTGPIADMAMAMALGRDNSMQTSSSKTFDNISKIYQDKESMHTMYQFALAETDNGGDNSYGWSEYYVDNILFDRFCNLRVCDATLYYATKLGYDNSTMQNYLYNYIIYQVPTPILKAFGYNQNKFENSFTPGDLISTQGLELNYQYKGYRVAGDTGIGLYLWGYKYYFIAFFIYFLFFYYLSTLTKVNNGILTIPLPKCLALMGVFFTFNNAAGICTPISTLLRTGWQDILVYCIVFYIVRKIFR